MPTGWKTICSPHWSGPVVLYPEHSTARARIPPISAISSLPGSPASSSIGGDGTLNSVISLLRGWDGEVLPLPGGTANLLCHRLFEQVETDAIIDALGHGALERLELDCIKGRSWIALSEILGGPGALWADVREEMRDWDVADTIAKSLEAIATSRDGPLVRVYSGQEELGRERGYAGVRLSTNGDALTVQAYRIESLSEFAAQGAAILGHNFRDRAARCAGP